MISTGTPTPDHVKLTDSRRARTDGTKVKKAPKGIEGVNYVHVDAEGHKSFRHLTTGLGRRRKPTAAELRASLAALMPLKEGMSPTTYRVQLEAACAALPANGSKPRKRAPKRATNTDRKEASMTNYRSPKEIIAAPKPEPTPADEMRDDTTSEPPVFYCSAPSCAHVATTGEYCNAHQPTPEPEPTAQTQPASSRPTKSVEIRNPDAPKTAKQVYAVAARALKVLGLDFPQTKGEASALIQELESLTLEEPVA